MRSVSLTQSIRQLALLLAGFLAVIALLESGGLASWANHLEIGPLRAVAVPVTATLQKALHPLGVGAIRDHALETLARAGWTDDPALLAEAEKNPSVGDLPKASGCATSASATTPHLNSPSGAGSPSSGAHILSPNVPGAQSPLLTDLPRSTALAPLPPVEPGKPRVVALAGDSMMAVGLSATLLRQAAGNKNLRMVKVFRSGTGLARPEVFDWMDEYPAMLGAEKPDVVIVAIGANDGQGFVVDGKVLPYGSEDWRKVYQERLANYLAMVGAGGARVVWVGLPPMRVPVYDQKIAAINRIAYTVVSQSPRAVWWNPASFVGDDAGKYREFVTSANGRTMRIRSTDGIHLSDEGADLLTTVLMKWLDPPAPAASGAATAPATAPAVQTQPAAKPKRRARHAAKG
jgi:lysophospholipase L1-like esterase